MHIIIDATTTQDQLAYAGIGQYTKSVIFALVKTFPQTQYSILLFDEKVSTLEPTIENFENVSVTIFPNPASNYVNIDEPYMLKFSTRPIRLNFVRDKIGV